jgi:hypothetical protein
VVLSSYTAKKKSINKGSLLPLVVDDWLRAARHPPDEKHNDLLQIDLFSPLTLQD